ncbi:MAG: polymorphic toxin-type HINT domain-containing protein [Gemmataceae bacterium]
MIEQLMYDMDQASRLGVSMRLGDLRVYGSDGNRSAFEAMVQAGQQIQQMGLHVLNTGLMVGSFIPGPIGVLSNGISMMMALANGDEATAIEMGIGMVARMNPCGRALLLRGIIRASKFVDAGINLERAHAAWQKGDYLTAGTSLLGAVSSTATFLNACFAAGTKLLTKRGWIAIEHLQVGDEVWSKPEGEPGHEGGWKAVEELFQRTGRIWHLHVGGELIRTTGEHPFFVVGKGWLEARLLQGADLLCSQDGNTVAVRGGLRHRRVRDGLQLPRR